MIEDEEIFEEDSSDDEEKLQKYKHKLFFNNLTLWERIKIWFNYGFFIKKL